MIIVGLDQLVPSGRDRLASLPGHQPRACWAKGQRRAGRLGGFAQRLGPRLTRLQFQ